MPNHAHERGGSPIAESDPEAWIVESYLIASRGDLEEALRSAARDVVKLNHLAAALGEGTSWGFLRRPRSDVFAPDAA